MRDFHGVYKAALDLQGYYGGPCRESLVTPGRRRHRRDHGESGLGRPPLAVGRTHMVLAELAGNGMEDRL